MITVTVEKTGEEWELVSFIHHYAEMLGIKPYDDHPELNKLWSFLDADTPGD